MIARFVRYWPDELRNRAFLSSSGGPATRRRRGGFRPVDDHGSPLPLPNSGSPVYVPERSLAICIDIAEHAASRPSHGRGYPLALA